mmetsp:Transcript_18370/g.73401  ORF Transcript_18370/g.73401 Transcript_18370/m.73401 type:complete len:264 (-) Transcript_18370:200-991(-)
MPPRGTTRARRRWSSRRTTTASSPNSSSRRERRSSPGRRCSSSPTPPTTRPRPSRPSRRSRTLKTSIASRNRGSAPWPGRRTRRRHHHHRKRARSPSFREIVLLLLRRSGAYLHCSSSASLWYYYDLCAAGSSPALSSVQSPWRPQRTVTLSARSSPRSSSGVLSRTSKSSKGRVSVASRRPSRSRATRSPFVCHVAACSSLSSHRTLHFHSGCVFRSASLVWRSICSRSSKPPDSGASILKSSPKTALHRRIISSSSPPQPQ